MDACLFDGDVSRINRAAQHIDDALQANLTAGIARPIGLLFQKAFHLRGRAQPSNRNTFKGFADQRGMRFMRHQHFAVAIHLLIAIAHAGIGGVVASHPAGFHPIADLFGVFLALVLRDGGEQVFHELAVRVLAKFE
ncbi:MAG: hypothetical protein AAFQ85_06640 [Pseudomonadota bacterium]